MEKIAMILFGLSCTTLVISVAVNIYAINTLEKCRDFLYFTWELVHGDFAQSLADRITTKIEKRHNTHDVTKDLHAVGGTD